MFDKSGRLLVTQTITGTEIVALLEALAGADRLDADAIEIADAGSIITATDVEAALQEIMADLDTAEGNIVTAQADIITAQAAADAAQADIDGFPNQLKNLVTAEIQQLENIGLTTISATQWGYLGGSSGIDHYVDRGDPAAVDFTLATPLTCDGAWHDLDLSSIVLTGATAVHITFSLNDDAVNSYFMLREKGNVNSRNTLVQYTQTANSTIQTDGIVKLDSNRFLEYQASNVVFVAITVTVRGWWI